MDIWIIYVVKTLLLPIASLLILCFFGCFYVIKNKGKGGGLLVVPLLSLFLLSLPVVAIFLAKLQQQYPIMDYLAVEEIKPQAIVVIGGGAGANAAEYGAERTLFPRTLLRVRYTAYLARKIKLPVLVSGGSVFEQNNASEASLMAAVLRKEFKVPVRWLEPRSRNTAENAYFSQQVLANDTVNRIVLVTHAMHMARAVEQFERVGLTVIPAPTAFLSMSKIDVFSFLPSARAFEISSMAIHEWLGRLWYSLRY
jgi:uncharacterized SAM-binding protein YcdF (DUF218 family)